MRKSLDNIQEINKLVKKSPRRESILKDLKQKFSLQLPGIKILCPTMWTVRADSIVANYEVLMLLWEESLEIVKETEMRSRISGITACMQMCASCWVSFCYLQHSDNLRELCWVSLCFLQHSDNLRELCWVSLCFLQHSDNLRELCWMSLCFLQHMTISGSYAG